MYAALTPLLNAAGMKHDDINWAVVGSISLRTQALVAGRIDLTTIAIEDIPKVEKDPNLHMIKMSNPTSAGWTPNVAYFTREAFIKNPEKDDAIQRYLLVMAEVQRRLATDQAFYINAVRVALPAAKDIPDDELKALQERIGAIYARNGGVNVQAFAEYLEKDYYASNAAARGKIDVNTVVEPKYARAIVAKLGALPSAADKP